MSTYDKIAWLPICGGLTGLGLVLSYLVMRRRGIGAGLRGVAWSLLPIAAYLTGSIEMFWKMGVAIGDFATGFVFSVKVWSGVALAVLAAVLFIVSGSVRRRRVKGADGKQAAAATGATGRLKAEPGGQLATRPQPTTAAAPVPAKARKGKSTGGDDDDLADVADILRRHGIT
jgi:hypothetical protein